MPNNTQSRKYIGIDLGTTNSAIACGWIDSRTQQFTSQIIRVDRQVSDNGLKEKKTLRNK